MTLEKYNPNKVHFSPKKGSNYLITTTFKDKFVVEYSLFQKITKTLFNKNVEFVTIYDSVINKRHIYSIVPTNEKTEEQKETKLPADFGIG